MFPGAHFAGPLCVADKEALLGVRPSRSSSGIRDLRPPGYVRQDQAAEVCDIFPGVNLLLI